MNSLFRDRVDKVPSPSTAPIWPKSVTRAFAAIASEAEDSAVCTARYGSCFAVQKPRLASGVGAVELIVTMLVSVLMRVRRPVLMAQVDCPRMAKGT